MEKPIKYTMIKSITRVTLNYQPWEWSCLVTVDSHSMKFLPFLRELDGWCCEQFGAEGEDWCSGTTVFTEGKYHSIYYHFASEAFAAQFQLVWSP
jgi:hypothetical protein